MNLKTRTLVLLFILSAAAFCCGAERTDGWMPFGSGFTVEEGEAGNVRPIWRCEAKAPRRCSGLYRRYRYENPSLEPVIYSGWSRSEGVTGGEYCLYLDIYYTDGSTTYGQKVTWPHNVPDWTSRTEVFIPKKPSFSIPTPVQPSKS